MDTEVPQLVFGDDGSAAADVVWLWVNNHRWPGWRISVVTAQPNQPGPPGAAEPSALRLWEPPEPRRLFVPDDVVQLEHLVAWADPRLMLDSCKEATLLAIGPRGTGELKRLHIGSTAEWLVSSHRPLTPVVIVRSARRVQRVLLCVDGSAHAQRAAQTLARLPWIGDCEITILGVRFGRAEAERGMDEAAAILHSSGVRLLGRRLTDSIPNIDNLRRQVGHPGHHRRGRARAGGDGNARHRRPAPHAARVHGQRRGTPRAVLGARRPRTRHRDRPLTATGRNLAGGGPVA